MTGYGAQPKEANDNILSEAEPEIIKIAKIIWYGRLLPEEQPGKAIMSKVLNSIMCSLIISAKGFVAADKCNGRGERAVFCV